MTTSEHPILKAHVSSTVCPEIFCLFNHSFSLGFVSWCVSVRKPLSVCLHKSVKSSHSLTFEAFFLFSLEFSCHSHILCRWCVCARYAYGNKTKPDPVFAHCLFILSAWLVCFSGYSFINYLRFVCVHISPSG